MVVKLEHIHNEEEMKVIHDETQKRWEVIKSGFVMELESIQHGLEELRSELKEFSGKLDHGWDEYDKRLEEHSIRISALSARMDKKNELDNVRDERIKAIKDEYKESIEELHMRTKRLES